MSSGEAPIGLSWSICNIFANPEGPWIIRSSGNDRVGKGPDGSLERRTIPIGTAIRFRCRTLLCRKTPWRPNEGSREVLDSTDLVPLPPPRCMDRGSEHSMDSFGVGPPPVCVRAPTAARWHSTSDPRREVCGQSSLPMRAAALVKTWDPSGM